TRKPACGCYCGGGTPDYVVFGNEDCAGILSADVCGQHMASLPPEERAGVCRTVRARHELDSCPALAAACDPAAERAPEGPGGAAASVPPDPDRDGVADGFGGGAPPAPGTSRPSPRRLVDLVAA